MKNTDPEPTQDVQKNQIEKIDAKIDRMRADIYELRTDKTRISITVSVMESDIKVLKTNVAELDEKVSDLDSKVSDLDHKVTDLDSRVTSMNAFMKESFTKVFEELKQLKKLKLLDEILVEFHKYNTDREVHAQHHHDINDRLDAHNSRISHLETTQKPS